jgi:hypothetical protein
VHGHESFPPARREHGGFLTDAVGVITEGLMKRGAFADGAINQISISRVAQGEDIRFDGHQ